MSKDINSPQWRAQNCRLKAGKATTQQEYKFWMEQAKEWDFLGVRAENQELGLIGRFFRYIFGT